jgi:hypothetical protein
MWPVSLQFDSIKVDSTCSVIDRQVDMIDMRIGMRWLCHYGPYSLFYYLFSTSEKRHNMPVVRFRFIEKEHFIVVISTIGVSQRLY